MSAGNWVGGGVNTSFSGPKFPPRIRSPDTTLHFMAVSGAIFFANMGGGGLSKLCSAGTKAL